MHGSGGYQAVDNQHGGGVDPGLLDDMEAPMPIRTIVVNPETFRIIAYVNFWIMVLFAMIVTKFTVDEDLITHSALTKVFGYNNVCVYWDYNPAIWATALVYPLVELPLLTYVVLNWFRTKKAYTLGHGVSRRHYIIATVLSVVEFVLFMEFRMIFVNRAFENVGAHTAPFTGFQFALTLNAIQNLLLYGYTHIHTEGIAQAYHRPNLVFDKRQRAFGKLYLAAVIVVTAMKQVVSWLAICKEATSLSFCAEHALDMSDPTLRTFTKTLDRLWMVLLAIIPLFIAIYTRKKSADMEVNVNLLFPPRVD